MKKNMRFTDVRSFDYRMYVIKKIRGRGCE